MINSRNLIYTNILDLTQKSELKNQLHEVHQEISNRAQKQLQDFVRQNPKIKQPDPEPDQSLKR